MEETQVALLAAQVETVETQSSSVEE